MSRQTSAGAHYRKYSTETLKHAVEMVTSKAMSIRQASNAFNIPRATLSYKLSGKSSLECRSGPPTVLTATEETHLAEWAMTMAKMGFGRTKNEVLDTVQKIIKEDGRSTPFSNNARPGKDWYYGFLKRHPELSSRSPQQLAKERAVITPHRVERWFADFSKFMAEENDDPDLWQDPTRWFNADESGFPLCPKSEKVLAPRGVPNVYNFTSSDKTQITVLACMNAAGYFVRPLVVFSGQRFSYNPLADFPEAVIGRTQTGWMDSDLFVTWLSEVFSPALDEKSIKRPVVLFVDGHSTHCTLAASKFCRENKIILYCLLEHGSHLMQPCDISLFSTLKATWKQAVRNFQITNVGEFVTRPKFSKVFKAAWEQACTVEVSVKGFRESGLFPLNPTKVTGTLKLEPSKIFTHQQHLASQASATVTSVDASGDRMACEKTGSSRSETPNVDAESLVATPLPLAVLAVDHTPASSGDTEQQCVQPSGPDTVSPVMKAVLTLPVAVSTAPKSVKRRVVLPKAIWGKACHDLLENRQLQKEKEIADKEARKREREEKKAKTMEEKERKAKEREEKKLLKEMKLKEKEQNKRVKEIEKNKRKAAEVDSSDSDVSLEFADDDLQDVVTTLPQACYAYDRPYDNNTVEWISCHRCDRWLHRVCVKTIDLLSMSEVEIADMEFECDYC